MVSPALPEGLLGSLDRTVGFVLRPVLADREETILALFAALRDAGRPVLVARQDRHGWAHILDRLRAGAERRPVAIVGSKPPDAADLAAFNLSRDVLAARHPYALWWCGDARFLGASAAAMPDLWSVRAPTLVLPDAEATPVPFPEVGPLLPRTEADLAAFMAWIQENIKNHHAPHLSVWDDPAPEGTSTPRRVDLDQPEELRRALRVLVAEPARLRRFAEACWDFEEDPWDPAELAHDHVYAALERLGAFDDLEGTNAGRAAACATLPEEGSLVPAERPVPPISLLNAAGARVPLAEVLAHHAGLGIVAVRTLRGAFALADAAARLLPEVSGRAPLALVVGDGSAQPLSWSLWDQPEPLATRWCLLRGRAVVLLVPAPTNTGQDVLDDFEAELGGRALPSLAFLPAVADPGPRFGWTRYDLAPLDPTAAHALIEAWLPEPREREDLLGWLGGAPARAPVLTDLERLLPILHGLAGR